MTKQALLAEILRLPDVPIPEWHVQELERRLATPDPQFVPWEEVRSRLRDAS